MNPETPLYLATTSSNLETMRELLEAGANPNEPVTETHEGLTIEVYPLTYALIHKSVEETRLLCDHGADPQLIWKFTYDDGTYLEQNPLYYALCDDVNAEVVKILMNAGADPILPRKESKNGKVTGYDYPLYAAVNFGNSELIKILLDAGADADTRYKFFDTENNFTQDLLVMYKAAADKNFDIVRLLLDYGADSSALMHYGPNKGGTEPLSKNDVFKEAYRNVKSLRENDAAQKRVAETQVEAINASIPALDDTLNLPIDEGDLAAPLRERVLLSSYFKELKDETNPVIAKLRNQLNFIYSSMSLYMHTEIKPHRSLINILLLSAYLFLDFVFFFNAEKFGLLRMLFWPIYGFALFMYTISPMGKYPRDRNGNRLPINCREERAEQLPTGAIPSRGKYTKKWMKWGFFFPVIMFIYPILPVFGYNPYMPLIMLFFFLLLNLPYSLKVIITNRAAGDTFNSIKAPVTECTDFIAVLKEQYNSRAALWNKKYPRAAEQYGLMKLDDVFPITYWWQVNMNEVIKAGKLWKVQRTGVVEQELGYDPFLLSEKFNMYETGSDVLTEAVKKPSILGHGFSDKSFEAVLDLGGQIYQADYSSHGRILTGETETRTVEQHAHSGIVRAAGTVALIYSDAAAMETYKRGEISEGELREQVLTSLLVYDILHETVQKQETVQLTDIHSVQGTAGWLMTMPMDNGEIAIMDIRSDEKYLLIFLNEIGKLGGITKVYINPTRINPFVLFWFMMSFPGGYREAEQHLVVK